MSAHPSSGTHRRVAPTPYDPADPRRPAPALSPLPAPQDPSREPVMTSDAIVAELQWLRADLREAHDGLREAQLRATVDLREQQLRSAVEREAGSNGFCSPGSNGFLGPAPYALPYGAKETGPYVTEAQSLQGHLLDRWYPPLVGLILFTLVSAIFGSFVVFDLSDFDFNENPRGRGWNQTPRWYVDLYLIFVSFAVGNILFVALLGVLVVFAVCRVQAWDMDLHTEVRRLLASPDTAAWKTALTSDTQDKFNGCRFHYRLDKLVGMVRATYWFCCVPINRSVAQDDAEDERLRNGLKELVAHRVLEKGYAHTLYAAYCDDGDFAPLTTYGLAPFPFAVLAYIASVAMSVLKDHVVFLEDNKTDAREYATGNPTLCGPIALPIIIGCYALLFTRYAFSLWRHTFGG
jgi:hypothetical protein